MVPYGACVKKFWRALIKGMVPIVLGAPRVDVEAVVPKDSFLHVDDFASPVELANEIEVRRIQMSQPPWNVAAERLTTSDFERPRITNPLHDAVQLQTTEYFPSLLLGRLARDLF